MAWEGELQRGAKWDESVTTKADAEVLLQFVAAAVTEAGLASSGELHVVVPSPDLTAMAAFAEAAALRLVDTMTETVECVERKAAAYFAGEPGEAAEPLVEALGRCAASVARLRTQAAQFAASARRMASRRAVVEEAGVKNAETRTCERLAAGVDEGFGRREGRKRKRNGRYFGPDWSTS